MNDEPPKKPPRSALSTDPAGEQGPRNRSGGPRRRELTLRDYVDGIRAGDRAVLGRALTLIESNRPEHQDLAQQMLRELLPDTGAAIRVGLTGVPGAGKSTFIETLGTRLTREGHRVAVLAVDPSSGVSGGSILGDKTRMSKLGTDPNAFVRPSPSGGTLGGVARKTRESMLVCEAAGYDVIVVETVGVGQSETQVAEMTDVFCALLLAGAGDELQGIKRGLLELVDVIAVNKADGPDETRAARAARQIEGALHIFRGGDEVPVLTCSALQDVRVAEVWASIRRLHHARRDSGVIDERRSEQAVRWMWSLVDEQVSRRLRHDPATRDLADEMEIAVRDGRLPAVEAAVRVIGRLLGDS
ncbi:MAG TPA: methylmalonyl Co-A mutase-associated GTPase MeaB [Candidatus Krumholzibacteria bacterium]|nr:methylmalonyl Co-A mutase-associated GTPase MeaB [Candidatus Krumholzibacteria bacterium]